MIASIKKKYFLFFIFMLFQFSFAQHFNVTIDETGESTLFIFQNKPHTLYILTTNKIIHNKQKNEINLKIHRKGRT